MKLNYHRIRRNGYDDVMANDEKLGEVEWPIDDESDLKTAELVLEDAGFSEEEQEALLAILYGVPKDDQS